LKKDDLVALAKEGAMLTSGTKATIIERLLQDEGEEEVIEKSTQVTPLSTKTQLSKLKKDELIALAKERGMLTSGTKATLIERLLPGTTRTLGGEEE
jgi:predicted transcriptional regulator